MAENKAGAGRGGQGGPTAKQAAEGMMSPAEKAARQEMADKKMQDATDKLYDQSKTTPYRKGGYVKAADGVAQRGKTKGTLVMCGGGMARK
jgi:hypothetical protein